MNGLPERRLDAMACFAPLDPGAVCSWLGAWNHSLGFARVLHLLSVCLCFCFCWSIHCMQVQDVFELVNKTLR